MRVIDLINVIKAEVAYTYYPNTFPATAVDDCAAVRLTGGGRPTIHIARPSIQLLIRSKTPATAESKAWAVYDFFNQKTDFTVGSVHVVYCTGQQSSPLYIGNDENGRAVYSVNFNLITD